MLEKSRRKRPLSNTEREGSGGSGQDSDSDGETESRTYRPRKRFVRSRGSLFLVIVQSINLWSSDKCHWLLFVYLFSAG